MHKIIFYLLLSLVLVFFSCQKQVDQPETFFDSLTTASINILVNQKASIYKQVRIGPREDTIRLQPDSTYWANDLEIFRQLAAFQKPAYCDGYKIEDRLSDSLSNLTVRQFKAVKYTPIPIIRFYYHHNFNQLKKIEADYFEENALYSTTRHLIMEFEEIGGIAVLNYYSIEGFQKMILSDSASYSINSSISF